MKSLFTAALLIFFSVGPLAQDAWKNIYSQPAWAARDKWQKAEDLIRLLKISSGSNVADIGSHEGYMTFKLAKVVGSRGSVFAVDLDAGKLEKLKKHAAENKLSQITIIKGEEDNPKLPANSLDGVIILDTYHEMDDHDSMLRYIKTSLKKGGRLVICDPIAEERRELSREEQERKHELAMQFAVDDLTRAGFKINYKKDPFIDRTKEKRDEMWVVVAIKE